MAHHSSQQSGHWSYATVRSDKPMGIGLAQLFLGISRTFLNIDGQWKELDADPMQVVQQMGRDGWELVNKTDETTPHNRLLTDWTFKKWIPDRLTASYSPVSQPVSIKPPHRNVELEEIAISFLDAGKSAKSRYANTLVQYEEESVFPLLYALANFFSRHAQRPDLSERQNRFAWGQILLQSEIQDVNLLFGQIGEPASRELCRALRDPNSKLRLIAALILGLDDNLSQTTISEIGGVLNGFDQRYDTRMPEHEKVFGLLLAFTLAAQGNQQWRDRVDSWVEDGSMKTGHQPQMDYSEWKEGMIDQAIGQLLGAIV